MKKVYLDNASTTQIRPVVLKEMTAVLHDAYGNPSSTHSLGRNAKNIVEVSRRSIASMLHVSASEIIFTSGGTEGNNWILRSVVKDLKVARVITSKMEHHAVLHTVAALQGEYAIKVDFVNIKANGHIDLSHLVSLLQEDCKTMVSLMHVNNEIGTILDIEKVSRICKQHNALFHSDMVQSVGKIPIDLSQLDVDFMVASGHKFHGPKGIGFAFVKKNSGLKPFLYGGEQEKGYRAGTEAVHQVAGMTKAFEVSIANLSVETNEIVGLKNYLLAQLEIEFPGFAINGDREGIYTILNVLLPLSDEKTAMILFYLDMKGIMVSRGSACQSGSVKPSHVLTEILSEEDLKKPSLRVSFSHINTKADIDLFIAALKSI